ncbi:MAG: hypothetical protein BWY77_01273 [bacterium ADurb.Bin431]|nr:MAG: hypothetical protein BWY77_01273 [bacterium ADurb.Bin431]
MDQIDHGVFFRGIEKGRLDEHAVDLFPVKAGEPELLGGIEGELVEEGLVDSGELPHLTAGEVEAVDIVRRGCGLLFEIKGPAVRGDGDGAVDVLVQDLGHGGGGHVNAEDAFARLMGGSEVEAAAVRGPDHLADFAVKGGGQAAAPAAGAVVKHELLLVGLETRAAHRLVGDPAAVGRVEGMVVDRLVGCGDAARLASLEGEEEEVVVGLGCGHGVDVAHIGDLAAVGGEGEIARPAKIERRRIIFAGGEVAEAAAVGVAEEEVAAHALAVMVEGAEKELLAGAGLDRALFPLFDTGGALLQGRGIRIDRGDEEELFAVG